MKLEAVLLCLLMLLLLLVHPARAGFDPELLSRSTVRVLIKTKQGVLGAASGFLWQRNDQIVTSLHVMSSAADARIIIEFGKIKRRGKIKAVLPGADLVLLEVKKPPPGWQPLMSFNGNKPKYKSAVSALGFHRGARGLSTRELRKGYVKPEQLQVLLPPDALARLVAAGVLDVQLPIYYLDGSLLPGYSGSPIVDSQGELIGIGDGGLESGAASVSWVIPAHNLDALVASKLTQAPATLQSLHPAFSGDVIVPTAAAAVTRPLSHTVLWQPKSRNTRYFGGSLGAVVMNWLKTRVSRLSPGILPSFVARLYAPGYLAVNSLEPVNSLEDEVEDEVEPETFTVVNYHQFEFVKVKSRSFGQMLSSSGSAAQMQQLFMLYRQFFHGYRINYQAFVFDIYEDGRYGLNIAVPDGTELVVDEQQFLLARGKLFCRTCDYEIQYHARTLDLARQKKVQHNARGFLNRVADQHWADLNAEGDFGEYDAFRNIEAFGADRYVLRAAFADFTEPFKQQFEVNYFTAATNQDAWFQAQGILNRFDRAFFAALDKYRGTDCWQKLKDPSRIAVCNDIRTMLKILISVHLTSFSNKFFAVPGAR